MSLDDELRNRFAGAKPTRGLDGGLDAGLDDVARASARRRVVRRVAATGAVALALVAGIVGAFALAESDDQSILDSADTTTSTAATAATPTTPASSTGVGDAESGEPEPIGPPPADPASTAIVTVDIGGTVRVNDEIVDPGLPDDDAIVRAADGANGRLLLETSGGVVLDGELWHKAPDARLFDVTGAELRNIVAFTIPEGNTPSGPVVGVDEWGPSGRRDRPMFSSADLGGLVAQASFGPGADVILFTAGAPTAECTRLAVTDLTGAPVDSHPVNQLSRCFRAELAAWSEAGHVVFARPTEEDAWELQVLGADGTTAQTRFAGAFLPNRIDVHTDPSGRTHALVLGTGEELVFVDVNAFLREPDPSRAVLGIAKQQNIVSARLVGGLAQHPYVAELDEQLAATPDPTPPVVERAWRVVGVADDDTLNARSGPGSEFDIDFELAHDAVGVVSLGAPATAVDGGAWLEVYNPISGSESASAWVNAGFLEPIEIPDDQPCLFNGPQDHYVGIDWRSDDASSGDSDAQVIDAITTYRYGACIRTVVELGTEIAPIGENTPADGLPADIVVTRGTPTRIDFGASLIAAVDADERVDIGGDRVHSVFAVIEEDRQLGALVFGPSDVVDVRFEPARGSLVIDVADLGPDAPPPASPQVNEDALVILGTDVTDERVTISGLARPFEATLALSLRQDGQPVEADFVGAITPPGEQVSTTGIMTTGWVDGWGRFEFTMRLDENEVDGLVLDFDWSGGAADEPTIVSIALADLTEFAQPDG